MVPSAAAHSKHTQNDPILYTAARWYEMTQHIKGSD